MPDLCLPSSTYDVSLGTIMGISRAIPQFVDNPDCYDITHTASNALLVARPSNENRFYSSQFHIMYSVGATGSPTFRQARSQVRGADRRQQQQQQRAQRKAAAVGVVVEELILSQRRGFDSSEGAGACAHHDPQVISFTTGYRSEQTVVYGSVGFSEPTSTYVDLFCARWAPYYFFTPSSLPPSMPLASAAGQPASRPCLPGCSQAHPCCWPCVAWSCLM